MLMIFRRNYSLITFNSINADKSVINNNYGRRLTDLQITNLQIHNLDNIPTLITLQQLIILYFQVVLTHYV